MIGIDCECLDQVMSGPETAIIVQVLSDHSSLHCSIFHLEGNHKILSFTVTALPAMPTIKLPE